MLLRIKLCLQGKQIGSSLWNIQGFYLYVKQHSGVEDLLAGRNLKIAQVASTGRFDDVLKSVHRRELVNMIQKWKRKKKVTQIEYINKMKL